MKEAVEMTRSVLTEYLPNVQFSEFEVWKIAKYFQPLFDLEGDHAGA